MNKLIKFLLIICATVIPVFTDDIKERGKIVGGSEAVPHQFPWEVSLRYTDLQTQWSGHNCGGVIIHENWVMSAAHCFAFTGLGFYQIFAGKHNISAEEETEQMRSVTVTIIHPSYNPLIVGPFDIALLRTDSPLEFNHAVQLILLPEKDSIPKEDAYIAGWGSISTEENLDMPEVLHFAKVLVLDGTMCRALLQGTNFAESNFCTGPLNGGIGTCIGDNGGGVVQEDENGNFILIGINTWGWFPCGQTNAPIVHERVSHFIEWINKMIESF